MSRKLMHQLNQIRFLAANQHSIVFQGTGNKLLHILQLQYQWTRKAPEEFQSLMTVEQAKASWNQEWEPGYRVQTAEEASDVIAKVWLATAIVYLLVRVYRYVVLSLIWAGAKLTKPGCLQTIHKCSPIWIKLLAALRSCLLLVLILLLNQAFSPCFFSGFSL